MKVDGFRLGMLNEELPVFMLNGGRVAVEDEWVVPGQTLRLKFYDTNEPNEPLVTIAEVSQPVAYMLMRAVDYLPAERLEDVLDEVKFYRSG